MEMETKIGKRIQWRLRPRASNRGEIKVLKKGGQRGCRKGRTTEPKMTQPTTSHLYEKPQPTR